MFKKLMAILLAAALSAGSLMITALAADQGDDLELLFEENFEEYEKDVNVNSTTMPSFFVCDANSIGDGVISVQEAAGGNLYLRSHVFTQVYTATPIVGGYDFSLDIIDAQGSVQTGVFVRAPKTAAAYYEGDGHPNTSVCQAGLFIYTRPDSIGVNVKTYDAGAAATAHLQNNTQVFNLAVSRPYNLRVTDNGEALSIYVNDTLICRVTMADGGKTYSKHESEGAFFGSAKLYDAEGNELATYTDTLLSSDPAYLGWTTRAADMSVDNVAVKAETAYRTVLAINKLPTKVTEKNLEDAKELAAAARALYDSLPEAKQALVSNAAKLTATEASIAAMETLTEAPTEPVTEPVTEPATPDTEAATNAPSDTHVPEATGESATTAEPTTAESPADTIEAEIRVVDDSLTIWILIAVMLIAVGATAGYVTVKVRK